VYWLIILVFLVSASCSFPLQAVTFSDCGTNPVVESILSQTSMEEWFSWVEQLSGAKPIMLRGNPTIITTRYSYAMFSGQPNALAFDYVLEQVSRWVPASQIEYDEYPYTDAERTHTWENLVVTLPGTTRAQEVILLTAHLDSVVVREGNALESAPGADDNASGIAVLLEAVRLFSQHSFERTIRIIFFTGEEQFSAGSRAYVADHDTANIVAVLNLDMFAYDSNGDRCLELHVGTLPASETIASCWLATAIANDIPFSIDYLTTQATDRSDHAPFWSKNIPAVTVMENFFDNGSAAECQGADLNPYYHRPGDTIDKLDKTFGFDVAKTALATAANLAHPRQSLLDTILR
jgi:hypothetical protein